MSAPTRRLVVVSHPAVLPVNQHVYAALAERGWHVDLVVPERWSHGYGEIVPSPLPTLAAGFHPLPVVLAGNPQRHLYRRRPARVLRRLRPDIVLIEQEPFSVSGLQWAFAAARAGIPFGVQAAENLDRPLPTPVRAWRSWVLRKAAFVAARSETAARLATHWGASGDVRVVPHHVPEWAGVPRTSSRSFRVGYAGRLVPEKGLDVLVAATRELGQCTELVVAGDGPLRGWLEQADLGGATLRLLTGLDHAAMREAYASMDVLVLPSRTTERWAEQFGRVLVEALWCGVPVVGSDSGEIPWVIETTGGGRITPEGDPLALAAVLRELRDDDEQRQSLACHGRSIVEQTFSVPAVTDALTSVLDAALGERRPSVALVAHGVHDHGGMERACAELVRHRHHEFAFTVVSAELAPELRPLVQRWVPVRVPMRPIPLKFVAFFVRAGLAVRRLDVDLVHTVGAIIPNRADVAAVHFCHAGHRVATRGGASTAPLARRINSGVARWLALVAERWCYRPDRVRTLAAVSRGVAAEAASHYRALPIAIAYNGIDTQRFRPDKEVRDAIRREQAVGAECVALFVGGDWDRKGLDLAVEAVAKARAEGVAVMLWVVGQGSEERVRHLASSLGAGDHVKCFGRREDTTRFYSGADLFLFPTAYEAFSLAMLEAAASELPMVVPRVSGTAELVGADEAGILVERTVTSIADALVALARDPEHRKKLGVEARRRALTFTWESGTDAFGELYRSLLAEHQR